MGGRNYVVLFVLLLLVLPVAYAASGTAQTHYYDTNAPSVGWFRAIGQFSMPNTVTAGQPFTVTATASCNPVDDTGPNSYTARLAVESTAKTTAVSCEPISDGSASWTITAPSAAGTYTLDVYSSVSSGLPPDYAINPTYTYSGTLTYTVDAAPIWPAGTCNGGSVYTRSIITGGSGSSSNSWTSGTSWSVASALSWCESTGKRYCWIQLTSDPGVYITDAIAYTSGTVSSSAYDGNRVYDCGGCVDECTAGQWDCTGSTYNDGSSVGNYQKYRRQCGNFDADSCLEWGSPVMCSDGSMCSGGSCVNCNDCISSDNQFCWSAAVGVGDPNGDPLRCDTVPHCNPWVVESTCTVSQTCAVDTAANPDNAYCTSCTDSRTNSQVCSAAGAECGSVADNCGVSRSCTNTCAVGETCSGNTCVGSCTYVGTENTETRCGNGVDDDCDGNVDCSDSGCGATAACNVCTDTCSSLGYECGNNMVCGVLTNCGSCSGSEFCSGGVCQAASCSPQGTITASNCYLPSGDTDGDGKCAAPWSFCSSDGGDDFWTDDSLTRGAAAQGSGVTADVLTPAVSRRLRLYNWCVGLNRATDCFDLQDSQVVTAACDPGYTWNGAACVASDNYNPIGFKANRNECLATMDNYGWTCDQDDFSKSLRVDIYLDSTFITTLTANLPSEAGVDSNCGSDGSPHRYSFSYPASYFDGANHVITAYARDINSAGVETGDVRAIPVSLGYSDTFNCPPPASCGNGVVDTGEQCDDGPGDTSNIDWCYSPSPPPGKTACTWVDHCVSTFQPKFDYNNDNKINYLDLYGATNSLQWALGLGYCPATWLSSGKVCDVNDNGATTPTIADINSFDNMQSSGLCAVCGDGDVHTALGEQCDDGNTASNDGCSSTCQVESTYVLTCEDPSPSTAQYAGSYRSFRADMDLSSAWPGTGECQLRVNGAVVSTSETYTVDAAPDQKVSFGYTLPNALVSSSPNTYVIECRPTSTGSSWFSCSNTFSVSSSCSMLIGGNPGGCSAVVDAGETPASGNGECTQFGLGTCVQCQAGFTWDSASRQCVRPELCNGIDDDKDGSIDEGVCVSPKGWKADINYCQATMQVTGWACDPDKYNQALLVDIEIDGSIVSTVTANTGYTAAIDSNCGSDGGAHGFAYTIPTSYFNGNFHTLKAFARNVNSLGAASSTPSARYEIPTTPGYNDSFTCLLCGNGVVDSGEACDPALNGAALCTSSCTWVACTITQPKFDYNNDGKNDGADQAILQNWFATSTPCPTVSGKVCDVNDDGVSFNTGDTGAYTSMVGTNSCYRCGDSDIHAALGEQCDDGNTVNGDSCSYPGCQVLAAETCNGFDDDDDGTTDEGCRWYCDDGDLDGYVGASAPIFAMASTATNNRQCTGVAQCSGVVNVFGDTFTCLPEAADNDPTRNNQCDTTATRNQGRAEVCNGIDDNCDGVTDNGGNALCDDGNACTANVCSGASGCTYPSSWSCPASNTVTCGAPVASSPPGCGACGSGTFCAAPQNCIAGSCVTPSEVCNDGSDNDGDVFVDERDGDCPVTFSLPATVNQGVTVTASWGANDGSLFSTTYRVCDYQGCTTGASPGLCVGNLQCSSTGSSCTFTSPNSYSTFNYHLCVGQNDVSRNMATNTKCGNNVREGSEACDDGNLVNGDLCSSSCTWETNHCTGAYEVRFDYNNDGFLTGYDVQLLQARVGSSCWAGKVCDVDDSGAFNANDPTYYAGQLDNDLCTWECGDGNEHTALGEECDDGDADNFDLCTNACTDARCGDGFLQPLNSEACDDGNLVPGDGCSATCQTEVCAPFATQSQPCGSSPGICFNTGTQSRSCLADGSGWGSWGVCTGAITPGSVSEICDGLDNDCDGSTDENGAALCNDGNVCTTNACSSGVCTTTPIANDCPSQSSVACGTLGVSPTGCFGCSYGTGCSPGLTCSALSPAGSCLAGSETSCSDGWDNDANGLTDEQETTCPIVLNLAPDPVDQGASLTASWSAVDGSLFATTYRLCDYQGCTAGGSCVGTQLTATTGSSYTFTAPASAGSKGYYVCVGQNSAYDTVQVNTDCGNNILEIGEACDDGNGVNTDFCSNTCAIVNHCLSNFVSQWDFNSNGQLNKADYDLLNARVGSSCWAGKVCDINDDGLFNSNDVSAFQSTLFANSCNSCPDGNDHTALGEECDDNNLINTDWCTNTCKDAKCGDGFIQAVRGELCDDGNTVSGDGCSATCQPDTCINGQVQTQPCGGPSGICLNSGTQSRTCSSGAWGAWGSCVGAITPGSVSETCNGLDDDCDGSTDENGGSLCNDGTACTVDSCIAGLCQNSALPNDCPVVSSVACGTRGTSASGCYTPCSYGTSCPIGHVCTAQSSTGTCVIPGELCSNGVDDGDADSWADELDADCALSFNLAPDPVDQDAMVTGTWTAGDGGLGAGTYRVCDFQGCNAGGTCVGTQICSKVASGATASDSCTFDAPNSEGLKGYYLCAGERAIQDVVTVNPFCGNNIKEAGEFCDDGNTVSGDGCSATCQADACINGQNQSISCGVTDVGACELGSRTRFCVGGVWGAYGACIGEVTAVAETCNGVDDDCDGTVDDGVGPTSQTCGATDVGACEFGTQTRTCNGVSGWSAWGACGGAYVGPSAEICDGLDNDCDGFGDQLDGDDSLCVSTPSTPICSDALDTCTQCEFATDCPDDGDSCTAETCDVAGTCGVVPVAPVCPDPNTVYCGNPLVSLNGCGMCVGNGDWCDVRQTCTAGTCVCAIDPGCEGPADLGKTSCRGPNNHDVCTQDANGCYYWADGGGLCPGGVQCDNTGTGMCPITDYSLKVDVIEGPGWNFAGQSIHYSVIGPEDADADVAGLTYTFPSLASGQYLVSAQDGSAYAQEFVNLVADDSVTLELQEPYCAAGCIGVGNRCNYECLGGPNCAFDLSSPVTDDAGLAYWAARISSDYSYISPEQLASIVRDRCDGVAGGDERQLFDYPNYYAICCGDASVAPPIEYRPPRPANVDADADDLIVFERIVRGPAGTPLVLNVVTIRTGQN